MNIATLFLGNAVQLFAKFIEKIFVKLANSQKYISHKSSIKITNLIRHPIYNKMIFFFNLEKNLEQLRTIVISLGKIYSVIMAPENFH